MSIPLALRAMLIYNRKKGGDVVMTEPMKMNIFDSVDNNHEASEDLPVISKDASDQDMLDYMVLVLSRQMTCAAAFKGGYMLNQLLGKASRYTRDIDFSISEEENYKDVKSILTKIAEKFLEIGLIAEYNVKETIAPKQSGGIDFYDATGAKTLGVDVGLHNISYGVQHYHLAFAEIEAFTIERMLADKLIAILTRKRFRRTKDMYDFYAITQFFDVDLKKLYELITIRGGAEWQNIPFNPTVIEQYQHAWDKLDLRAFGGSGAIAKPDFDVALDRFYEIALTLKDGNASYKWEHENERLLQI